MTKDLDNKINTIIYKYENVPRNAAITDVKPTLLFIFFIDGYLILYAM